MPSTLFQSPNVEIYSRRLLLQTKLTTQPSAVEKRVSVAGDASEFGEFGSKFDNNAVMILAVLLCALICVLGLNSIVRFTFRCSSCVLLGHGHEPEPDPEPEPEPEPNQAARRAQTGLKKKILEEMPVRVYSTGLKIQGAEPECAICLTEFECGEPVRVLPGCDHAFHVKCIDRWLLARSSCPTCRQCMSGAENQRSDCDEVNRLGSEPVRSVLVPLEPEGFATDYEF